MGDHILPEEADGVHRLLVGSGWADLDGQHELFHTGGLIAFRDPDAGVGVTDAIATPRVPQPFRRDIARGHSGPPLGSTEVVHIVWRDTLRPSLSRASRSHRSRRPDRPPHGR